MRISFGASALPVAIACATAVLAGRASAQSGDSDAERIQALQKQVQQMQERLDAVAARTALVAAAPRSAADPGEKARGDPPAEPRQASSASSAAPKSKGTLQFYGHLDLSFDVATKGLSGRVQSDGTRPVGDMGWLPAVATNGAFAGVRGRHDLGTPLLAGIFQIETQVDVSATPGYSMTNFAQDSRVAAALASRTSYLGLAGPWGALKAGKSDTPYYLSTRRMDPFFATVGTNTSIMGNTGGDNRVEFGYRTSHAIWYESPARSGFSFSALVSPGQNRNEQNLIQAAGEPNCTGLYVPGIVNALCNDGAFGTAWSLAAQLHRGPLYATGAWELHERANRTVDEAANGGASPDGSIGIANEWALKGGVEYALPSRTTLGVIVERLARHDPYLNQQYNERDRWGFWVELVQKLDPADDASLGWAHAGKTAGDVGTRRSDGTTAAGPVDNVANMYAAGLKHHFLDGQPTVYLVYARQVNTNGAHYDLGAGTHGVQYDCHDAGPDAPDSTGVPLPFGGGRCFAGATLQAVSIGMTYDF